MGSESEHEKPRKKAMDYSSCGEVEGGAGELEQSLVADAPHIGACSDGSREDDMLVYTSEWHRGLHVKA